MFTGGASQVLCCILILRVQATGIAIVKALYVPPEGDESSSALRFAMEVRFMDPKRKFARVRTKAPITSEPESTEDE